jgi:hypothetical protein
VVSNNQRPETQKAWLSAQKHLSPRTQSLVSADDQSGTLRSCCVAESHQTFALCLGLCSKTYKATLKHS